MPSSDPRPLPEPEASLWKAMKEQFPIGWVVRASLAVQLVEAVRKRGYELRPIERTEP